MKTIKIKSPATVSNLVCGFDILGMAIREPNDVMELSIREAPGIEIIHTDNFGLPLDPAKNIAGVALEALIAESDILHGFKLIINKKIKPGSGIGSSAASAAGVVVAANKLLNAGFSNQQLVRFAMEGEVLASGAKHADNLAPCIYGGLTLIRDTETLDIQKLSCPPLFVTVVHPQIEIKTSYAREILPKDVPLKLAVKQWANVAAMTKAFIDGDLELLGRAMEDFIVEPVRSKLIPGYDEVKSRCKEAGVIGGGISGSGPSLFMLSELQPTAHSAGKIMKEIYDKLGNESIVYVTTLNDEGVTISE